MTKQNPPQDARTAVPAICPACKFRHRAQQGPPKAIERPHQLKRVSYARCFSKQRMPGRRRGNEDATVNEKQSKNKQKQVQNSQHRSYDLLCTTTPKVHSSPLASTATVAIATNVRTATQVTPTEGIFTGYENRMKGCSRRKLSLLN